MFSTEIHLFLESKNYNLSKDEYLDITDLKKNPQISHIKYDPFNNTFFIETKDEYSWIIRVY